VQKGPSTPPWEQNTYVSTVEEDDSESSEMTQSADATKATADDGKIRDPDAARELALAAVEELISPYDPTVMTPALVVDWENKSPKVMYIIYPLYPMQSGVNKFKVGAPMKVTVSLEDGSTQVEKLPQGKRVKTMEDKRDRSMEHERIVAAELALIEVLLGERTYIRATGYLDGYEEWFLHHDKVTIDLKSREPVALAWHRKPHE